MNTNAATAAGHESKDRTVFSRPPLLDALSLHPSPHVQRRLHLPSSAIDDAELQRLDVHLPPSTGVAASVPLSDYSSPSPLGAAAPYTFSLDDFSSSGIHSQSEISPTPPPPPPPQSSVQDPNQNLLLPYNEGAFHGNSAANSTSTQSLLQLYHSPAHSLSSCSNPSRSSCASGPPSHASSGPIGNPSPNGAIGVATGADDLQSGAAGGRAPSPVKTSNLDLKTRISRMRKQMNHLVTKNARNASPQRPGDATDGAGTLNEGAGVDPGAQMPAASSSTVPGGAVEEPGRRRQWNHDCDPAPFESVPSHSPDQSSASLTTSHNHQNLSPALHPNPAEFARLSQQNEELKRQLSEMNSLRQSVSSVTSSVDGSITPSAHSTHSLVPSLASAAQPPAHLSALRLAPTAQPPAHLPAHPLALPSSTATFNGDVAQPKPPVVQDARAEADRQNDTPTSISATLVDGGSSLAQTFLNSYEAIDNKPLPPPRRQTAFGTSISNRDIGGGLASLNGDANHMTAISGDTADHRRLTLNGNQSAKNSPDSCGGGGNNNNNGPNPDGNGGKNLTAEKYLRENKSLQKKNGDLQGQVQRLEKRLQVVTTENDSLKKKAENSVPAEEKIKRLKRKNAELAAIARRLEEKSKNLEQKEQNRSLPVGKKMNTSDSSIGAKTKLRPSSSSTSALNSAGSSSLSRRNSIGGGTSPTIDLEGSDDLNGGNHGDHVKKVYARQRAKDLAEHAKVILGKDKEIDGLRENVRSLTDRISINESHLLFGSGKEGNVRIVGEAAELHRVVTQAAKERLMLESRLLRLNVGGMNAKTLVPSALAGGGGVKDEDDDGAPPLPAWAARAGTEFADPISIKVDFHEAASCPKSRDDDEDERRTRQLEELRTEIEKLALVADENEKLRLEVASQRKRCGELESVIAQKQVEVNDAKLETGQLTSKECEVAKLSNELTEMREKLNVVEGNLREANGLTNVLTQELKQRCADFENVERECQNLRKKLRESETAQLRSEEKVSSLESRLSHIQSILINLQSVSSQYENLKLSHTRAVQELHEKDDFLKKTQEEAKENVESSQTAVKALEEKLKKMEEKLSAQSNQHNSLLGKLKLKQDESDKWKSLYSHSMQDLAESHSKNKQVEKQHEEKRRFLMEVAQGATVSANAANLAATAIIKASLHSLSDGERSKTPPIEEKSSSSTPTCASPRVQKTRDLGKPTATSSPMKKQMIGKSDYVSKPNHVKQSRASPLNFVLYKACREYRPKGSHESDSYRHLTLNIGDYVFVSGNRLNNMLEAELLSGHNGFVPHDCVERVEESDFLEMATVKKMFAQLSRNNQNDVSLSVGNTTLGCDLDLSSGDEVDPGSSDNSVDSGSKIICFADTTLANTSGELVPPPTNLICDVQMGEAILVSWNAPVPEGSILRYLVLLNDSIFIEIAAKQLKMYRTILDGVDLDSVHRVSIKSVSETGCSATSACTALIGKGAEPFPSELLVSFVTCDSATVTWLPGNSNLSHFVYVNEVEGGRMPAGVYSTIVSGLKPQTTYQTKIIPEVDNRLSVFASFTEITTKSAGPLEPPLDVSLGSGLSEGKVRIQWLPLSVSEGKFNAHKITAYAVFANGVEVARTDSSMTDSIELDLAALPIPSKITVRTVSGKISSEDSVAIHLPNDLFAKISNNFTDSSLGKPNVSETDLTLKDCFGTSDYASSSTDSVNIPEDQYLPKTVVPLPTKTFQARRYQAKYSYDPVKESPNVDKEVELAFSKDDILNVFGDKDEDGFFIAELRGSRGLVPSNYLVEYSSPITLETIAEETPQPRENSFNDSDLSASSTENLSSKRSSFSSRHCPSDDVSSSSPTSPPGAVSSDDGQTYPRLTCVPQLSSTKMSIAVSPSKSKTVKRFSYASAIKSTEAVELNGNESHFFSLADLSGIPKSGTTSATLRGIKMPFPRVDASGDGPPRTTHSIAYVAPTISSAAVQVQTVLNENVGGGKPTTPHVHRGEQSEPPSLGSSIVSSPPTPTFDPHENQEIPDVASTSLRIANAYPPTWLI